MAVPGAYSTLEAVGGNMDRQPEVRMISKLNSSKSGHVRVRFELPSYLWAAQVHLVGDFNGWNRQCTPLRQERDGIWRVELDLPYGQRFEFRYLVDNRWLTDSHSDGVTTNPFGTQNSIVQTDLPGAALRLGNGEGQLASAPDPKRTRLTRMD